MKRLPVVLLALALFAAACGGGDDSVSSEPVATTAGSTSSSLAPTSTAAPAPSVGSAELTSTVGSGWSQTAIGEGTKPVLALDGGDLPAIAFLFEDVGQGFVAYSSAAEGWNADPFVEGYFYGPIGLDFDSEGRPNIAYHDHQGEGFDPALGDLTYAVRDGGDWRVQPAFSDGHDGWDSTIRVGPDGVVRAAGVDPSQFSRVEGVEYYELIDGAWVVEPVGSGPIEYEWNVDLQMADDGTVGITYFATEPADLMFARRSPGGDWSIEEVATEGDVGRFSSFAFDPQGTAHVSYWNADTGEVMYATDASGGWESSVVADLTSVQMGFEGARRITSLALDPQGSPVIAYSDTTGVWLARPATDGGTWESESVVTAGSSPLGQLVSLAVDGSGASHLTYFEVTANSPLDGNVVYVTDGG